MKLLVMSMLDIKGGLPFENDEGPNWESLKAALRHMDFRQRVLRGDVDAAAEISKIETFRQGIKSLALIDHDEYAGFLHKHVVSGGQIDMISTLYSDERPLTIFRTTQALTVLPDCEGYVHLDIMVLSGHKLEKENPNDGCKVYDLDGTAPMPPLKLYRDTANIMLRQGWKPAEENFSETCSRKEIDKLLIRGRKNFSYGEPSPHKK